MVAYSNDRPHDVALIPDPWQLSHQLADVLIAYVEGGGRVQVEIDQGDGSLHFQVTDPLVVARFLERGEEAPDAGAPK